VKDLKGILRLSVMLPANENIKGRTPALELIERIKQYHGRYPAFE